MKNTGKWAQILDEDGKSIGVRMLNEDRSGRPCVRYQKQWWLVAEKRLNLERSYQLKCLV